MIKITVLNMLFICSRNQWRSPTAEAIYMNSQEHQVKSGGTSASARIRVSEKLIDWADIIFAMEKQHKELLHRKFREAIESKRVIVMDIPDEYQFMDEELIEQIKTTVSTYI